MPDISTNNWDVVSITDLDTLNNIINSKQDGRAYPETFDGQDGDSDDGITVSMSGSWGDWTVTSNASGAKVNIRCDISKGSFVLNGNSKDINDGNQLSYVDIELSLASIAASPADYISPGDIMTDNTRCYRLMADPDSSVTVVDMVCSNADIDGSTMRKGFLKTLMSEWFNSHISEIKQVFSVVLLGLEAGNTDFQWLYPSAYSYAASSSIDKSSAGFGALTLVDGRTDTGSLSQDIDIAALSVVKPYGANLALVISKSMFVKHLLMKAAVGIVKGSTTDDFTISDTGLSLSNNREMVWQDFDDGKGNTISPVLPANGFILDLQSDFIHLSITGAHYRPNGMCTVTMGVEQNFRYKVEKNASGEPVFVPDEQGLGNATVNCTVKPDKWVGVMDIVLGVIAGVAALLGLGAGSAAWIAGRAAATVAEEGEEMVIFAVEGLEEAEEEGAATIEAIAAEAGSVAAGKNSSATLMNAVKIFGAISVITGIPAVALASTEDVWKSKYDDMPSFHDFARCVTGTSVWPGIAHTELKSATLADSFVIGLEMK
ncbi:TULIP family P47-like protein [Enterobacter hormaechei]|nr:TULIP family P47-like protein [Enterobacter hormaechei]